MTKSYLNSSQNIVQAGGNSGSALGAFASMIMGTQQMKYRLAVAEHMSDLQTKNRKDLITHQTDENIRRDEAGHKNKAIYGAAGRVAESQFGNQAFLDFYDKGTARYAEDHPDVVAGKIKKDVNGNLPYLHPEAARAITEQGIQKTPGPLGTTLVSNAGVKATKERERLYESGVIPTKTSGDRPSRQPKEKKTPKPKFEPTGDNKIIQPKEGDFQGYTPRKTGVGGYDQALKEGKITDEEHKYYMDEAASGPKNYMSTEKSNTINTLVKERQDAEAGRTNNLNDGINEGNK